MNAGKGTDGAGLEDAGGMLTGSLEVLLRTWPEKVAAGKATSGQDSQLLTELLAAVVPSGTEQVLAAQLLAKAGGLFALLAAAGQGVEVLERQPEAVRVLLLLVREAVQRLHREAMRQQHLLSGRAQVHAYLQSVMGHEKVEQIRVLFLNDQQYLLRDEVMARGTVDQAPVYPRELVRRALQLGAAGFVLAHNHPSGNPTPSEADIVMTARIVAAAGVVGLTVWDHVIIGAGRMLSMKEEGLL